MPAPVTCLYHKQLASSRCDIDPRVLSTAVSEDLKDAVSMRTGSSV